MSKKSFDPAEAALEGFRVVAKRWGHVLGWSALFILVIAVAIAALVVPFIVSMQAVDAARAVESEMSAAPIVSASPMLIGLGVTALIVSLIIGAVWNCAVFRIVLRPEEGGFLMMRLGGDELRSLLMSIVVALLVGAIVAVTAIGAAVGVGYLSETQGSSWAVLAGVIGGVLCTVIWTWVAVRLSLVLPYTFHKRRLTFGSAVKLSGGVFWKLLGMWLLAFIIYVAISTIGGFVVQFPALLAIPALAGVGSGDELDIGPLLAVLVPIGLLVIVGGAIVQVISSLLLVAPGAAAVRDLTAESA